MARSLIREAQIVDADVLSEEEHRNLDHSTLFSGIGIANSFIDLADTPADYSSGDYLVSTTSGITYSSIYIGNNRYVHSEVATQDQTIFPTTFDINNESIYLNGVLLDSSEYSTGSNSITLTIGASAGDLINIISFPLPPFVTVTDFVQRSGDTMQGDLDFDEYDLNNVNNLNVISINDGQLAGFRNIIINGDFNIWQRGSSFGAVSTGEYTADRWQYSKNGTMIHTVLASTVVPTIEESGRLSNNSLTIDVTTADTVIDASNYALLSYAVEGYDFKFLVGKYVTLSFWVNSHITGTYCVAFRSLGTDRSYICEYTVNTSATWEKKEITMPLIFTGGTWNYTNNKGLIITWSLACGSNYHTTPNTWQIGNYLATANQANSCASTTSDFRLSQIQLEIGSRASKFESRPISTEFSLCQRYYGTGNITDGGGVTRKLGESGRSAMFNSVHSFKTEMRASPTVTLGTPTYENCATIGLPGATSEGFCTYVVPNTNTYYRAYGAIWTADAEL